MAIRPERGRPSRKVRSTEDDGVSRKGVKRVVLSNRTVNRHRWVSRVDSGEREKYG